jgi:hypothetical protein
LLIQLERNRVPIRNGESYTFDFGTKELINMVGMPMAEGKQALRELLKNSRVKALDNKIHVTDISEIDKQAKYYRKMQKIERARQLKKQTL